jgi:hypothetical protein
MGMEKTRIENTELEGSLVVVSAKEHGKIFQITNGELFIKEYIEEHPPGFSDDEGFFVRSAKTGMQMGSGYAKEINDEHNIKMYIKAISQELSAVVKHEQPKKVLVFEPEHLKGMIAEHLVNPNHIPVEVVQYGNFVQAQQVRIAEMINDYGKKDELDPSDPASVAGEENAEEKRKILEVGEMLDKQ